ncbi:MAG: hypothetical protein D3916_00205, partial [Candidatus Electrothrix sp. MAN1_4]|nr:hypothetical protein [Candidatus Electrothrix sp. MAN1_4]
MSDKKDISQVRQRIDEIDNTILSLLQERLDCAHKIGVLKKESSRSTWDPRREREIYERLLTDNKEKFPDKALRRSIPGGLIYLRVLEDTASRLWNRSV